MLTSWIFKVQTLINSSCMHLLHASSRKCQIQKKKKKKRQVRIKVDKMNYFILYLPQVSGMKAIYTDAGPGGLSLSKVLNDQLKRACEMQKEDALTSSMFRVCALLICTEGKISKD